MSTLKVTNIQATGETASRAVSGVAAAWVNFNGIGTVAIRDSFNVASITDNGTGDYTENYSNSFSAVDYSASGGAGQTTGDPNRYVGFYVPSSSSSTRFVTQYPPASLYDGGYIGTVTHGDLA